MKTFRAIVLGAMLLSIGFVPGVNRARADLAVSASVQVHASADFYTPLAPHGAWIEVGSYGRCFRPAGIAVDWRPYCDGHWVWTDSGWFWASDEPWGWACYHYGTWVDDPDFGWVWVPGIDWAPAWVEWRVGGGFIGWAPCAPRGVVVAPGLFGFVAVDHFADPVRLGALVVNSPTIIRQTSLVSGTRRVTRDLAGNSVRVTVNRGPDVKLVERATGSRMTAVSIRDAAREMPAPGSFRPADRRNEPAPGEKLTPPTHSPAPANVGRPTMPSDHTRPATRDQDVSKPDRQPPEAPPETHSHDSGDSGGDHGDHGGGDHGGGDHGGHGRGGF